MGGGGGDEESEAGGLFAALALAPFAGAALPWTETVMACESIVCRGPQFRTVRSFRSRS